MVFTVKEHEPVGIVRPILEGEKCTCGAERLVVVRSLGWYGKSYGGEEAKTKHTTDLSLLGCRRPEQLFNFN